MPGDKANFNTNRNLSIFVFFWVNGRRYDNPIVSQKRFHFGSIFGKLGIIDSPKNIFYIQIDNYSEISKKQLVRSFNVFI